MSGDFISDFLGKLSAKTGREWTLLDLMRLAEKLPDLNEANVDSFLALLSEMGLSLPEQKRETLKEKIIREDGLSPEDLEELKKRFAEKEAAAAANTSAAAGKRHRAAARRRARAAKRRAGRGGLRASKGNQRVRKGRLHAARENLTGGRSPAAGEERAQRGRPAAAPRKRAKKLSQPAAAQPARKGQPTAGTAREERAAIGRRRAVQGGSEWEAHQNQTTFRRLQQQSTEQQTAEPYTAERQYMAKVAGQLRRLQKNRRAR